MENNKKIITNGVKYIGSKKMLIPFIIDIVEKEHIDHKRVIDVFSGTTRVAQAFKQIGSEVITSDLSPATETYSNTFIGNENNKHLQEFIDYANNMEGYSGWITENYSSKRNDVKMWQEKNGKKADAIRDWIETLSIKKWEKDTLVTSLIFALDAVDNTVGVQQAYLKNWCTRSYKDLFMTLPKMIEGEKGRHIKGDSLKINYPTADLAYLDPPYSAHSYATYYHIWDSITLWDKPETSLKTNRRIDRCKGEKLDFSMSSVFNKKAEALTSLLFLIERLPANIIMLSYNDEGLIEKHSLLNGIATKGYKNVSLVEVDYRRNIMSSIGNSLINGPASRNETKEKNKELIITIKK